MSRIDGPAVGATPGSQGSDGGANRAFKERSGSVFRASLLAAVLAHVAVLLLNPGWGALAEEEMVFAPPATELVTLPMTLDLPKPPEPLARPSAPVVRLELPDDLTIAGELVLECAQRCVDGVALVTDDEITDALALLLERAKLLVEPAGAAATAALLAGKVTTGPGETVVAIASGGNIDGARLQELLRPVVHHASSS